MKTVTQEQKADVMSLYNSSKGWDYEIKIADDVKLKDYFADFAERTSSEKHFLVGRINESLSRNMSEERKQEVFDLAKINKEAFAYWYDYDDRLYAMLAANPFFTDREKISALCRKINPK